MHYWGILLTGTVFLSDLSENHNYTFSIDSCLINYRESEYDGAIQDDDLLHYFNTTRFSGSIDSCYQKNVPVLSIARQILWEICQGNCRFYGPLKADDLAYKHYLKAFELSKINREPFLEIESLRALIRYGLLTNHNLEEMQFFIDEHGQHAYDELETLWNEYFQLRCLSQKEPEEESLKPNRNSQWLDLIEQCEKLGHHRLETETRLVYAVQLGTKGSPEKSIIQNEKAIISSQKFSAGYAQEVSFVVFGNIGAAHIILEEYHEAIASLKEALNLNFSNQQPANQVIIYEWLAQCFENLGQYDSAYHYLGLSYQTAQDSKVSEHAKAVKEIQSQYDNDRLSRALIEESLRRKNNNLTALTIGSILFFTSLSIWFNYYRQKRKTREIARELVVANKEIQLTAVNARLDGQEQARKNLAGYLHDNIVGQLVAANMHLKIAGKDRNPASVEKSAQLVHDAGIQLRNISHDLYPPILLKLGIGPALADLCEKYSNEQLQFSINSESNEIRYKGEATSKVYYAVQELLNNVVKHSEASACQLTISTDEQFLFLEIQDDGIGFTGSQSGGNGLGLSTVKARIDSLHGHFERSSAGQEGTCCMIRIPLDRLLV